MCIPHFVLPGSYEWLNRLREASEPEEMLEVHRLVMLDQGSCWRRLKTRRESEDDGVRGCVAGSSETRTHELPHARQSSHHRNEYLFSSFRVATLHRNGRGAMADIAGNPLSSGPDDAPSVAGGDGEGDVGEERVGAEVDADVGECELGHAGNLEGD